MWWIYWLMRSISSGNPDANHCCASAQSSTHSGYIHTPEHKKNLLDRSDFVTAIPVLCRKIVLDEDCPGDGTNKNVRDRSSVGILVLLVFSQRFPRFVAIAQIVVGVLLVAARSAQLPVGPKTRITM